MPVRSSEARPGTAAYELEHLRRVHGENILRIIYGLVLTSHICVRLSRLSNEQLGHPPTELINDLRQWLLDIQCTYEGWEEEGYLDADSDTPTSTINIARRIRRTANLGTLMGVQLGRCHEFRQDGRVFLYFMIKLREMMRDYVHGVAELVTGPRGE